MLSMGVSLGELRYAAGISRTESKSDTMSRIKKDAKRLIKENKRLEKSYSQLREKLSILQNEARSKPMAIREAPTTDLFQMQPKLSEFAIEELNSIQVTPKQKAAENRFVSGELTDYSEQINLLELRLADKQYQRRELELELKLRKVQVEDEMRMGKQHEGSLAVALQNSLVREKQLAAEISRLESHSEVAPAELPLYENENTRLEEELEILQKEREFEEREVAILRDKKLLKEKSAEDLLAQIEAEKVYLANEVDMLKQQHNQLEDTVSQSLRRQGEKKKLLEEIIFYDRENQKLQAKIKKLNDQIDYFEF